MVGWDCCEALVPHPVFQLREVGTPYLRLTFLQRKIRLFVSSRSPPQRRSEKDAAMRKATHAHHVALRQILCVYRPRQDGDRLPSGSDTRAA